MQKILDDTKRKQIIAILAIGGTRTLAAQIVGCNPRTIYNAAKADTQFNDALIQAEGCPEYNLLRTVNDAGMKVPHAAKWGLERIYPDRYRPRPPGTFSVDAVRQLLATLAARLAEQAGSEQERQRILETIALVGKDIVVSSQPFIEQALEMLTDIGTLVAESPLVPTETTLPQAATDTAVNDVQEENSHAR